MIQFARPWFFLLLLAIPLWLWWRSRLPVVAVAVGELASYRVARRRGWKLWLPPICRLLSWSMLAAAAAGPYRQGDRTMVPTEGIAIVLAIDVSSSMIAEDFAPSNRIAVARQHAAAFVRGRKADRIGLVSFAGEAITQVPVTLDYPALLRAIASLETGQLVDGTAIGSGLATAVARLRKVPGKEKVILLLTDGENNRGLIDPRTAAQTAQAFGIRVYTIGVGTDGEARVPTGRGMSGFRYEVQPVQIDEELLTEIAEQTGGQYYRARDAAALGRIFHDIDQLEKTTVETVRYIRHDERVRPFVLAAVGLLMLELLLASTIAVRAP